MDIFKLEILKIFLEIGIIASVIYLILLFIRGTRGAPILAGFIIAAVTLTLLSSWLKLEVINFILNRIWTIAAFALIIIFQPEIRRALAELGVRNTLLLRSKQKEKQNINIIIDSTFYLAERKIGALIAIEREIGMRALAETGVQINAKVSQQLLTTFFYPNTPLHDGGVIIRDSEVFAAGCFFPLTQDLSMSKSLGTRHRAGVGVSEETDCVCIVVSEESGTVSLAYRGRLVRAVSRERMERHLINLLVKNKSVIGNLEKIKQAISEEGIVQDDAKA